MLKRLYFIKKSKKNKLLNENNYITFNNNNIKRRN